MFCYTFSVGQNNITVDSGKKTKAQALEDINNYLDAAHPGQPLAKLRQIETFQERAEFVALKQKHA